MFRDRGPTNCRVLPAEVLGVPEPCERVPGRRGRGIAPHTVHAENLRSREWSLVKC